MTPDYCPLCYQPRYFTQYYCDECTEKYYWENYASSNYDNDEYEADPSDFADKGHDDGLNHDDESLEFNRDIDYEE